MDTEEGVTAIDLWSELVAEEQAENRDHNILQEPRVAVVYGRRRAVPKSTNDVPKRQSNSSTESRVSFAPLRRDSRNRSLSLRGRTSISVASCLDYQRERKKPKRRGKPAIPRGKAFQPSNYEKERAYFQLVDAFELLEESPSPGIPNTWATGNQSQYSALPHISTVLKKWLIMKKLNYSYRPSDSLSRILETPALSGGSIMGDDLDNSFLKTPEKLRNAPPGFDSFMNKDAFGRLLFSQTSNKELAVGDSFEDIEKSVGKLSLEAKRTSLDEQQWDPFWGLLAICEQTAPMMMSDVFCKYCDLQNIVKVGEGTYGEAYKAGNTVCKIVPFDGDLRVNGEVQKKAEELLEEAVLSQTLNRLRGRDGCVSNLCSTFIETIELRVCQGSYDASLIKAWEDWDGKHGSENDHPKEFPEKQLYAIFVLEHGGKDLESFVLLNFNEARSLLVQVTVALAVAEAEYEFEHRDLHWGNILLSRKTPEELQFTLEGKPLSVQTFGLAVSIIDFTLSRINTGEDILFLDLSLDPALFEGPKGDKQSETYRKMKAVTEDCWEGSFPKTNVLWLQYLVDILLLKKSFERTSKDERELRSLKKRLGNYDSAREATSDAFFKDLLTHQA